MEKCFKYGFILCIDKNPSIARRGSNFVKMKC